MKMYLYEPMHFRQNSGIISVIVPVYNSARYLDMCLASLENQTYQYWEAILVNDGSTDDSLKILQQYAARDSRFKVIDKAHEGVAAARNAGLDAMHGNYVTFLDTDNVVYPQFFEIMLKTLLQTRSDFVWCKGEGCAINSDFNILKCYDKYQVSEHSKPLQRFILRQKPRINVSVWGKLCQADLLHDLRFNTDFKETLDDYFYALCMFERAHKVARVRLTMVAYRRGEADLKYLKISPTIVDDNLRLLQFSAAKFKKALTSTLHKKLLQWLSIPVFQYACLKPYFETKDYMEYWEKYSAVCQQSAGEGIFSPRRLSLFNRYLCRLFLAQRWKTLRFWLHICRKICKKPH